MAPRAPGRREQTDDYAAYLVVDHFGGLTLRHDDENPAGAQVDYLIMDEGAAVGALAVRRNTSRSRRRNVPRDMSFAAPALDNSWDLTCSLAAAPTWVDLKKTVIPVLQRMELGGRTAGGPWRGSARRSDRELAELHVLNAEIAPTTPTGNTPTVRLIVHWGDAPPSAPETPLRQLEQWLADAGDDQTGLRAKLGATGLAMRHVFVWTDAYATGGAGRWLDTLPSREPELPTEVTHVWLASGNTGWRWAPDRGWGHITHLDDAHRIASNATYDL